MIKIPSPQYIVKKSLNSESKLENEEQLKN